MSNSSLASKKSYVWDQLSDEEDDHKNGGDFNDSVSAMSSISRYNDDFDAFEAKYSSKSVVSVSSEKSRKAAAEILEKVKVMQNEFNELKTKEAELKKNLEQIALVKERRTTKLKVKFEAQLSDLQKDNALQLSKGKEFINKLELEIKQLNSQKLQAIKKLEDIKVERERALTKCSLLLKQENQRAKAQAENNEKIAFEKAIKGKSEQMKKQAIDALAPKLDQLVKDNKQTVIQHREKAEISLEQLSHSLQLKADKKFTEFSRKVSEDIEIEKMKTHKQCKIKQDELKHKFELDLQAARARFLSEKSYLDDAHDKTTRLEIESHQETLQMLNKKDSDGTSELLDKQQREIGYLVQEQTEQIANLKKQIKENERTHIEQTKQRHALKQAALKEKADQQTAREINAETNAIVMKLREDALLTRKMMEEQAEREMDALRAKLQTRMEGDNEQEKKLLSSLTSHKSEIDSLTHTLQGLKENEKRDREVLENELKPELVELRLELRKVETEWASLDEKHETELTTLQTALETENNTLRVREETLRQNTTSKERECREKSERMNGEYKAELDAIRDKISRLVRKKESVVVDLRSELEELIGENAELNEKLERVRESKHDV